VNGDAKVALNEWFGDEYEILHHWTRKRPFPLIHATIFCHGSLYFMTLGLMNKVWLAQMDRQVPVYHHDDYILRNGKKYVELSSEVWK
jgi:hypothetical protein